MRGRGRGGGCPLILLTPLVIVQADKSMHVDPLTKVLLNILRDTQKKKRWVQTRNGYKTNVFTRFSNGIAGVSPSEQA